MNRPYVDERDPSQFARHCDISGTPCEFSVTLSIQPSVIPAWDALVVIRCPACDAEALSHNRVATAVRVTPVIPFQGVS